MFLERCCSLLFTQTVIQKIESFELNTCIVYQYGNIRYVYEKAPGALQQLLPINSCTKSILSALICLAMDQHGFPKPEERASTFFPELLSDPRDKRRRKPLITIEHLLTLSAGFQWTEFGGSQSFPNMSRSTHWIHYVLQQPLSDAPGMKWTYNSGVSQMLAEILKMSIGKSISSFAEQALFKPLGIQQYEWEQDPQGTHTGGFGIKLSAEDLLSFGQLYLQRGLWNGKQLISSALIDRSVTPAIAATSPDRGFYGWHWWIDTVNVPRLMNYYYARGFGGQFVFIIPDYEAVVITTRERNKRGFFPHDLFRQYIAPRLV